MKIFRHYCKNGFKKVVIGYDYSHDGLSRLTRASYRKSGRAERGDYTAGKDKRKHLVMSVTAIRIYIC